MRRVHAIHPSARSSLRNVSNRTGRASDIAVEFELKMHPRGNVIADIPNEKAGDKKYINGAECMHDNYTRSRIIVF